MSVRKRVRAAHQKKLLLDHEVEEQVKRLQEANEAVMRQTRRVIREVEEHRARS